MGTKVAHMLGDSRTRVDLQRVDLPKKPAGRIVAIKSPLTAEESLAETAQQIELIKIAVARYLGLEESDR